MVLLLLNLDVRTIQNEEFTFQYGATSTLGILSCSFLLFTFTFQYGATSTELKDTSDKKKSLFTFQYGATSTYL